MKLRPIQIAGLGAILVFGGYLAFMLIKGPRDPDLLPSGVRVSDLPTIGAEPVDTTSLPADPLAVGSQDAKDDLYCSGLIYAEHTANDKTPPDQSVKQLNAILALAESGAKKLISEGAAIDGSNLADVKPGSVATATVADAHTDKAKADYDAKTPRIPLATCMARATTLKPAGAN